MQSKKITHLEVLTNQISGVILGWLIVYFIFPLLGIPVTIPQATITTAIFFVTSYTRMYIIRRIFNKIRK